MEDIQKSLGKLLILLKQKRVIPIVKSMKN